ncbi:hypothetical protein PAPHI01_2486 [Pancytospora philotis]|nr:hypothetical protein PAPHI01_2486 [Pancytospora philotis]
MQDNGTSINKHVFDNFKHALGPEPVSIFRQKILRVLFSKFCLKGVFCPIIVPSSSSNISVISIFDFRYSLNNLSKPAPKKPIFSFILASFWTNSIVRLSFLSPYISMNTYSNFTFVVKRYPFAPSNYFRACPTKWVFTMLK